ncbi:uncharacterized protein LOC129136913 isoform X2 [Pan troglodytes]|uniref:uncharacterized protein LOC129136913 isoform X2 n=1 Tax=Pan troglodytes TaxID=9598 RepID=UPI0023F31998|nr:uncharacterized protein LOC129136913 isoform X2 [Pan troglodytes]
MEEDGPAQTSSRSWNQEGFPEESYLGREELRQSATRFWGPRPFRRRKNREGRSRRRPGLAEVPGPPPLLSRTARCTGRALPGCALARRGRQGRVSRPQPSKALAAHSSEDLHPPGLERPRPWVLTDRCRPGPHRCGPGSPQSCSHSRTRPRTPISPLLLAPDQETLPPLDPRDQAGRVGAPGSVTHLPPDPPRADSSGPWEAPSQPPLTRPCRA